MSRLRNKTERREKNETKTSRYGDIEKKGSLLLHTCCSPCLTYTAKEFEKRFDRVTALWFNPNIHPFEEYENRFRSLKKYEEENEIEVIYIDEYGLKEFLEGTSKSEERCDFCLTWRLEKTAKEALKRDHDAFSTTLILSPYQDHERLKHIGSRIGEEKEIEFIYEDMRDGFQEHHRLANEMGLYKQNYCGCIFSEEERFKKDLLQV